MKGDKYHLTLDNPDLIIFYNGKKRVSYRVEEKEYEFLDEDENIFSPQDIFRNYAEHYNYTMGKDAEVNGNLCYAFSLIPKNQDTPAHQLHSSKVKIELFINKTTYEIQKIITEEDNKRQIVLEIFQLKKNRAILHDVPDLNIHTGFIPCDQFRLLRKIKSHLLFPKLDEQLTRWLHKSLHDWRRSAMRCVESTTLKKPLINSATVTNEM